LFFVSFSLRTILFSPVLLRLSAATPYHSSIICRHSFVSLIPTGQLLEAFYRCSFDHYFITRAQECVIARLFLLTCKLRFFLHVHVSESRGTMILPAGVMQLCLLFTYHFALSYTEISSLESLLCRACCGTRSFAHRPQLLTSAVLLPSACRTVAAARTGQPAAVAAVVAAVVVAAAAALDDVVVTRSSSEM
jgi:hypothetical protein